MKKPPKIRINVFLDPEIAKELVQIGQELGMTKTGIVSLASSLGLQALKLSRDPKMEEYFKAQVMKHEKK